MLRFLHVVLRWQPGQQLEKSFLLPCLLFVVLLAACGRSAVEAGEDPQVQVQIRAAHPTFTPTPRPAAPMVTQTPAPTPAQMSGNDNNAPSTNPAPQPPAPAESRPKAILNAPFVNLRAGPGTDQAIIAMVERGAEYEIVGKNPADDWWYVCCVDGQTVWVTGEFVDTEGPVDSVPVVTAEAQAVAPTPAPTVPAQPVTAPQAAPPQTPTTATPPPDNVAAASTPAFRFNLVVQEQFPEPNVVRVFLYVYDDKSALEGFTLRITKDGVELPVDGVSFGPNPGFTWPVADPRQRWQNLKVEFPGQAPAGIWEVQLMQNGAAAGPPATFILQANDPQQELYVRYERQEQ